MKTVLTAANVVCCSEIISWCSQGTEILLPVTSAIVHILEIFVKRSRGLAFICLNELKTEESRTAMQYGVA